MKLNRKTTSRIFYKDKRKCYKSDFTYDKQENSYKLLSFLIVEFWQKNFEIYINSQKKYWTYSLSHAKLLCESFCEWFSIWFNS